MTGDALRQAEKPHLSKGIGAALAIGQQRFDRTGDLGRLRTGG